MADFAVRVFTYYRHGAAFYRGVETPASFSCRHFFIVVRLLRRREEFTEADFPRWREPLTDYNEYAGMSADEQNKRCGLIVDPVRMPSDPGTRI
jgi:hypothetical protein